MNQDRLAPTVIALILSGGMAITCFVLAFFQATRAVHIADGSSSEWTPVFQVVESIDTVEKVWTDVPGRRRVAMLWKAVALDGRSVAIVASANTEIGNGWLKPSTASVQALNEISPKTAWSMLTRIIP